MATSATPKIRKPRGFAVMDPEEQRRIASLGGKAVDPANRSFSRDRSLAAAAGAKGGKTSRGGKGKA